MRPRTELALYIVAIIVLCALIGYIIGSPCVFLACLIYSFFRVFY